MHKPDNQTIFFSLVAVLLLFARPLSAEALHLGRGFTIHDTKTRSFTLADATPPLADRALRLQARNWLRKELEKGGWQVHPVGQMPDRYGRRRVHLVRGEADLAVRMVESGHAMAGFDIADATRAARLISAEKRARSAGRGRWMKERPHPFAEALSWVGHYALVEGRIERVETHQGHVFLAFGEDWRTDATGFIPAAAVPRFERLPELAGKHVRLRGWIEEKNGPSILLVQPYAIEVIP